MTDAMTSTEAREQFSAAYEAELSDVERTAFEAALSSDPNLAAEYQRFVDMLSVTRRIAAQPTPAPDLLPSIQARIRKRTRGRFYRDRQADKTGLQLAMPILITGAVILICGVVWMVWQMF